MKKIFNALIFVALLATISIPSFASVKIIINLPTRHHKRHRHYYEEHHRHYYEECHSRPVRHTKVIWEKRPVRHRTTVIYASKPKTKYVIYKVKPNHKRHIVRTRYIRRTETIRYEKHKERGNSKFGHSHNAGKFEKVNFKAKNKK